MHTCPLCYVLYILQYILEVSETEHAMNNQLLFGLVNKQIIYKVTIGMIQRCKNFKKSFLPTAILDI